MTLINYKSIACPPMGGGDQIVWSGVTDGAMSLTPSGTTSSGPWTPFATIPITTGSIPLVAGLVALVWMSWNAVSASGARFSIAERKLLTLVQGASSPASYAVFGTAFASMAGIPQEDLLVESINGVGAPDGLQNYVQIVSVINATSGDLDICQNCLITDQHGNAGVNWSFTNISAEYRIIGAY